jgi:trehalose/maltose hydrolase-like predicted phosphorylase
VLTGPLEEHVVAEVAWAADCYLAWTGDRAFRDGPGLRLFVETARYWASRVRVDDAGRAHIDHVIGPDEYHEDVDDNAFTNVMARWNLRRAAGAVAAAGPAGVAAAGVAGEAVGAVEVERWEHLAASMVDGYDPESGRYEQFRGFYELEPLIIEEIAPRRPIAAELLLGMDRVHEAQVVKQADVVMLHHLLPDEVAPGSLVPNLAYYEPRTAHGSSLSPGIHAALFARVGDMARALESLRMATHIDLDDLTGTTSGGLHLATMGGVWLALAFGFAGVRPHSDRLWVDPRLPPSWRGFGLRVRYRGSRVELRVDGERLRVVAERPVPLLVGAPPLGVAAGPAGAGAGRRAAEAGPAGVEARRTGTTWEVVG